MSGKKTWAASLALLLVVLLVALYAWKFRSDTHRQVAVNDTNHSHPESRTVSQLPATMNRSAMPTHQAPTDVATYRNVRFDFAIDYPAKLLIAGQEADDGDGMQFTSTAGNADIRAYGSYNALEQSPAEMLQSGLKDDCAREKVAYQISKSTVVAYSCLSPAGRIVYEKVIIRADTLVTVRFDYDPHEQAKWSPVIKQMADTLRLGSGPTAENARADAK